MLGEDRRGGIKSCDKWHNIGIEDEWKWNIYIESIEFRDKLINITEWLRNKLNRQRFINSEWKYIKY